MIPDIDRTCRCFRVACQPCETLPLLCSYLDCEHFKSKMNRSDINIQHEYSYSNTTREDENGMFEELFMVQAKMKM